MKTIKRLALLSLVFALMSCPPPAGPGPSETSPGIHFSIEAAPSNTYAEGPIDLVMDSPGSPFTTIADTGTGNRLYVYAMGADGAYTVSGSSNDYVLIRVVSAAGSYAGTYTSSVIVNACIGGTIYLNDPAAGNTLTLDATVSTTPTNQSVSGSFSGGMVRQSDSLAVSIQGTFLVEDMAVAIPSGS